MQPRLVAPENAQMQQNVQQQSAEQKPNVMGQPNGKYIRSKFELRIFSVSFLYQ